MDRVRAADGLTNRGALERGAARIVCASGSQCHRNRIGMLASGMRAMCQASLLTWALAGCSWGELQQSVPPELSDALPPEVREVVSPPPEPALPTWSKVQGRFLEVRGNPIAYTIGFANQRVTEDGGLEPMPVRRTESWVYPEAVSVFDAGYFVQEKPLDERVEASPASLSPAFFSAGTQPEALIAKLGEGEERTSRLGPASMRMISWREPEIVTVSWVEGALTSVVVGIGVEP